MSLTNSLVEIKFLAIYVANQGSGCIVQQPYHLSCVQKVPLEPFAG